MTKLRYITDRRPRSGSDYTIAISETRDGRQAALFAVLDTIGKPRFRGVARHVRQIEKELAGAVKAHAADGIDALTQAVRGKILEQNRHLQTLTGESMFGFGMAMALCAGSQCRILSLGDCRAYLVRPESKTAQCLTIDHNRLWNILAEQESYVFLQNEFQELSRTLTCFWGMAQEAEVTRLLDAQARSLDLLAGDAVLLVTDGVFLPIVRSLMEFTNYKLDRGQFTLESWFREFIEAGEYAGRPDLHERHKAFLFALIERAERFTSRKARYRDDMASILAYVDDARLG